MDTPSEQEFAAAKETCDRAAVQLQGFEAASKILGSIGSLTGMVKSLEKQLADLGKERDAAQADLKQAQLQAKELQTSAVALLEQAQLDAGLIVGQAKTDAAKLQHEASERAALDLANAKKEHANELATVKGQLAFAKKELETLQAHIRAAIDAEAAALKKKESLEKELADVQARAARLASGG